MAAFLAGALLSGGAKLLGGLGKGLTANSMVKDQKRALKNLKMDNYISPALTQALGNSQKRLNATMYAGQDIDQANIEKSSANAFNNVQRATTSSTNLLNAAMGIQGAENQQKQGLQRNLAAFKDGANRDFTGLLIQKAGVQDANRRQYQAAKSALQGSIMQNKAIGKNAFWNAGAGALDGVGSALMFKGMGSQGGQGFSSSHFADPNKYFSGNSSRPMLGEYVDYQNVG
jgi:hypothetical protein